MYRVFSLVVVTASYKSLLVMGSTPNPYEVVQNLVEQGWIPLRQLAVLLGYKDPRGIYPRQKGPNSIPTIQIGGIIRAYTDDVVTALEGVKENKRDEAQVYLALIRTATAERKRKEKHHA